jgi:hypothetical protein
MTVRSALHDFYRRLQLANELRLWEESTTNSEKPILFDIVDYGVAEDWTEWDTTSSIN